MTCVFLTIDTEFAWRHHAAGLDVETIYARSIEPAGVGLSYQLDLLAEHGLKACFFVDPMPALVFGLAPVKRMVDTILAAGQEVQLHLHPSWTGARVGDRGACYGRFQLHEYTLAEQRDLIRGAAELLVAAGAPPPVAFHANGPSSGPSRSPSNRTVSRAFTMTCFPTERTEMGTNSPGFIGSFLDFGAP